MIILTLYTTFSIFVFVYSLFTGWPETNKTSLTLREVLTQSLLCAIFWPVLLLHMLYVFLSGKVGTGFKCED